ncbi:hypothetical protein N7507_004791 [Penicillium longicatenatum]|nr:hypothetical protein N7507_004791 [Penicillium longicatenatum]
MFAPVNSFTSITLVILKTFRRNMQPNLTRLFVRPGQEQLSKQDLKVAEVEACQTVRNAVIGGIFLYLSPFAVDFAKKFL